MGGEKSTRVGTNISCIKPKTECLRPENKNCLKFIGDVFLQTIAMIFTGFLVAFLISFSRAVAESSEEEIPFVVASQGSPDDAKISNLLPEVEPDVPPLTFAQSPVGRGRSDIEIENDQSPRGYFYPKPTKSFNLPVFKTLDANAPLGGDASFAEETPEIARLPRSPQRRPPYFQSPPPFIPGFIPPNQIRPRPALYGRPQRY